MVYSPLATSTRTPPAFWMEMSAVGVTSRKALATSMVMSEPCS